jgi:hypothetical protein
VRALRWNPRRVRAFHWNPRRVRAFVAGLVFASCTPVSQSYQVHSADIGCDEANRYVYKAVEDMHMKVTSFNQAHPGQPGHLTAVGRDRSGSVDIRCNDSGVEIKPNQTSFGDKTFERGIFLSVTGRSGLKIDQGEVTGREKPAGDLAQAVAEGTPAPSGSVLVDVQPQRGFESVLDFDADLSAAGILPIRFTIRNGSKRSYSLTLEGISVRLKDSEAVATRMSSADAAAKLSAKAGSGGKQTDVGNVESAKKILAEKELKPAKLTPGASATGYLYYPVADYDRAKIQMMDIAAEEAETFLVEF